MSTIQFTSPSLLGKVAIYCRVSTEEQCREEENSLDNQIHRCRAWLVSQGASPEVRDHVRIYREEGYSGKDTNRPQLQELLRDVRQGKVAFLIFTELSRISRSVADFLRLSQFLKDKGVKWVSLSPNIDTSSHYGEFMLLLLVALAELERKTTADRTRKAFRDRSERGLFNGGNIPFGYQADREKKGGLQVVESEAQAIRDTFSVYLETGSIMRTVEAMQAKGYRRTARESKRGRLVRANQLTFNVVNYILRNPVYVGLKEVNREKRDLPEEEALALDEPDRYRLVPAIWEPIIEPETFEQAQVLLQENRRRTANSIGPSKHAYVLTGIVRCGVCGQSLEGAAAKKQRYHYYRHDPGSVTPDCGPVSHRVELIEGAVVQRLADLAGDDALLNMIIEKANARIEDGVPEKEKELQIARRRVEKLESDQERLTEHLLTARPDEVPKAFWAKAKSLEAEVEAAKREVIRLQLEVEDLRSSRLKAEDYRTTLRKFAEVYEELDALQKANMLAYLLDRVEVRPVFEGDKVAGTEITIGLVGEPPDVARYEKGAAGQYQQPPKWLRQ